jgi:ABC-type branched-subunit amino acid transport system substrate-binding protein
VKTKTNNTKIVVLLTAVVLATCTQKPAPLVPDSTLSDDPEVERNFRLAREAFEQGDFLAADQSFQALIEQNPDDPMARVATIYRARISIIEKDPAKARILLEPIVGDEDPIAERAAFYDGIALYKLRKWEKAAKRLAPFAGRMTDPEENRLLLDTLWKASLAYGNSSDAVVWLDQTIFHLSDEEEKESKMEFLEGICKKIDDIKTLKEIETQLDPKHSAWPLVMARIAELYFDAEEFGLASRTLNKVKRKERSDVQAVQVMESVLEKRSFVDLSSLGLIVPLSGRSRLVGEAVLKGVMLGAKTTSVGPDPRSSLTVVIRDSGGNPEQAAKAVEELVFSEHVAAILGPVDGSVAEAAAQKAEELGVPMIALSIKDDLPNGKQYVFREFGSNSTEVQSLVAAAKRLGNRKYGILYPNSGYGLAMRDLFANELAKQGLKLTIESVYVPGEKVFVETAQDLAKAKFDAVFIPDKAANIALIAPALAAAGLWSAPTGGEPAGPGRAIQILLPSTGLSPDLVRRAGRYLDGALFTSFFFKDTSASAAKFTQLFVSKYGTEPNYLAGFGYDATVLVASAIASGASNREEIRRWLTESGKSRALPLTTPFNGFSNNGEPLALPFVLQLKEGKFSEMK